MGDKASKELKEKSDIKSGTVRQEIIDLNGGLPPEKTDKQINKANDPAGHGRAPGSVRV